MINVIPEWMAVVPGGNLIPVWVSFWFRQDILIHFWIPRNVSDIKALHMHHPVVQTVPITQIRLDLCGWRAHFISGALRSHHLTHSHDDPTYFVPWWCLLPPGVLRWVSLNPTEIMSAIASSALGDNQHCWPRKKNPKQAFKKLWCSHHQLGSLSESDGRGIWTLSGDSERVGGRQGARDRYNQEFMSPHRVSFLSPC